MSRVEYAQPDWSQSDKHESTKERHYNTEESSLEEV
jgi:hypothetical protein